MEPQRKTTSSKTTKKSLNRIQRHPRYWNALLQADPQQREQLVRYATPDQVDALSEMAYNLLKGTPPLPSPILRRLRPFKESLRGMSDPRKSRKARRQWIVQEGGSAVGALVQGFAQGLKEGARQGLRDQKGNVVRGLKEGAQRTVKNMFSSTPLSKESKIQQLEKEIQTMEESLKGT